MTVLEKRKPSADLISLLNVAASGMLAFGELWDTVKKKGVEEGFDEKALLVLFAPMVKDKFTAAQVRYLMNKEKEQERARDNRQKQKEEIKTLRTYAHIPPKKEPEQSQSDALVQEEDFEKWQKEKDNLPVKDSTQFYKEQEEEPTELELKDIKIAQLEDALHQIKQFKPATALEGKRLSLDETAVFEFLSKRDNGVNIYYFDNYGRELFSNRILSQLRNSGVKTFKRLYFEV